MHIYFIFTQLIYTISVHIAFTVLSVIINSKFLVIADTLYICGNNSRRRVVSNCFLARDTCPFFASALLLDVMMDRFTEKRSDSILSEKTINFS